MRAESDHPLEGILIGKVINGMVALSLKKLICQVLFFFGGGVILSGWRMNDKIHTE